jgi:hypothetical protein
MSSVRSGGLSPLRAAFARLFRPTAWILRSAQAPAAGMTTLSAGNHASQTLLPYSSASLGSLARLPLEALPFDDGG